MYQTTIHIERPEGNVIATGLAAQVELAAPVPAQDADGNHDFLVWEIMCWMRQQLARS